MTLVAYINIFIITFWTISYTSIIKKEIIYGSIVYTTSANIPILLN